MVGQINLDLKQPGNAEKLHLNLYGNQGGSFEGNAYFTTKIGKKWETTLLGHTKNESPSIFGVQVCIGQHEQALVLLQLHVIF